MRDGLNKIFNSKSMNPTPQGFEPMFGRRSQHSVKKHEESTPPTSKFKLESQTPTNYNTPASRYESIISENSQLAEQLAAKSIECNTLRLFIENIQQSWNEGKRKLVEENRHLLKDIVIKEEQHIEFIDKHIRSIERLETEFRDYRYQKQREIQLLREELGKRGVAESFPNSPDAKHLQAQIDQLITMFNSMNPDSALTLKQNNPSDQMPPTLSKLRQEIAIRDTDIRLLKQQIHNLASTFSEQISKVSGQLSVEKESRHQLEQILDQQRVSHEEQLARIEGQRKECMDEWRNALTNINQREGGVRGGLLEIQAENIILSQQLEDKINRLLEGDLQNCNLSISRERMEGEYQRLLDKQNEIRELKQQLRNKEENIREILERYKRLEDDLERIEVNNYRIMEISRRRITTEQVREVEGEDESRVTMEQREGVNQHQGSRATEQQQQLL